MRRLRNNQTQPSYFEAEKNKPRDSLWLTKTLPHVVLKAWFCDPMLALRLCTAKKFKNLFSSDWGLMVDVRVCLISQSYLTLCNFKDLSLSGSSVLGILQARILEQVAISFSRVSFQLGDWTHISCVSCIAGIFFTHWAINPNMGGQIAKTK